MGSVGLFAFSGYKPRVDLPEPDSNANDCTSKIINGGFTLAAGAGTVGLYTLWERWCWTRGIALSPFGIARDFARLASVLLLVTAIHELGHALMGLTLGMKLSAFCVGPFEIRLVSGSWQFQFNPAGFIAVGGNTGVVPSRPSIPVWHHIAVLSAGPLASFLAGLAAISMAVLSGIHSPLHAHGFLVLFGAFSLMASVSNLVPLRVRDRYSDGARIRQMLQGGPWADYQRSVAVVSSALITEIRPRDFDIEMLQRAAAGFARGRRALLLRLYAYACFLDQGRLTDAARALKAATLTYEESAFEIPAQMLTVVVFGCAYVLHDSAATRVWWERMKRKRQPHVSVDYWLAKAALHWSEGNSQDAAAACWLCEDQIQKLPSAGAHEFYRHCCRLLGNAIDGALYSPERV